MLNVHIDDESGIVFLSPENEIRVSDLDSLANKIDSYIASRGKLNGVLVNLPALPHWESFQAMLNHFRFVRDHYKHVEKIAVVSDVKLAPFMSMLARSFMGADVCYFHSRDSYDARTWLEEHKQTDVDLKTEIRKPGEIRLNP
jgi:hypothetical protein